MPESAPDGALPITKDLLVDIGGWPALKQGQAMVEAGRVLGVAYQPPLLTGRILVDGREMITRLRLGRRLSEIENLCPCRQAREDGTVCAHVMAAGWAWLRRQEIQAAPALPAGKSPPPARPPEAAPAPARWKRCLLGRQPPEAAPLEIFVLLPLGMPKALLEPQMRVILEARAEGPRVPPGIAGSRPWHAVMADAGKLWAISEEDEALVSFLEQAVGPAVPGMFLLPAAKADGLLRALIGHPRAFLGKKEPVRITGLAEKPALLMAARQDGSLELSLPATPADGTAPDDGLPGWRWEPGRDGMPARLTERAVLDGPYAALRQGPVAISREAVPAFLTRELPALARRFNVRQAEGGDFVFAVEKPRIAATLDGSLAGVTVRLEAVYPRETILLPPRQLEQPVPDAPEWRPDPGDPRRFWGRDLPGEKAALEEAHRAGFQPGHRSPDQFVITGERETAAFLANVLPRWRRQWDVRFGERFASVWPRIRYVEPEVTVREGSGEDWLSLDITPRGGAAGEFSRADVHRWLQMGQHHQRIAARDGGPDAILLFPGEGWHDLQQALADSQARQEGGTLQVGAAFMPYLANVVQAQGWRLAERSAWPPKQDPASALPPLPPALADALRPYQATGVEWMAGLARSKFAGLLADEMGLGKTIQVLALLRRLLDARLQARQRGGAPMPAETGPALVVAPTSVVPNWQSEAATFTPELRVLPLTGSGRQARFAEIPAHDLVLTSYALLRRDIEAYRRHAFNTVVLDEAQHIKNRESQNAQSAKALQAGHRFVLTGTPIENSLADLWSIFDFLMPGYLGQAKDFRERYEVPVAKHADEAAARRLRQRLQPFVLRRTKAEVIRDLPDKLENIAWCELTDEQAQVYEALLAQGRKEVFEASAKAEKASGRNRFAVLAALLRLRQASCHLGLLPAPRDGRDGGTPSWEAPSGKFDLALELLDEALDGGHRLLIFSQFVQLLRLFRTELEKRAIDFAYLDGATAPAARQAEISRFQARDAAAPPVFLISLKAGGTGLNLTAADTVLHLDPWWNPAVEDQATARAHRIGQQRVVTAYKLIARGTVEEKILHLQQKKRDLIESQMTSEETFIESLTWEEIESLL